MKGLPFLSWIDWKLKNDTTATTFEYQQADMFEDELAYAKATVLNWADKTFNSWTATEEEAIEAMQNWCANGGRFDSFDSPWFKYSGAKEIKRHRKYIESEKQGAGFLVMECMSTLVSHGLTAPDWLAEAFCTRHDAVALLKVRSWDEAFGDPHPPNMNIDSYREYIASIMDIRIELGKLVLADIYRPIDANLFGCIADNINTKETEKERLRAGYTGNFIKASTAKDYYYKSIPLFGTLSEVIERNKLLKEHRQQKKQNKKKKDK